MSTVDTDAEIARLVQREWRAVAAEGRRVADELWARPELGLEEAESARILSGWLEREGFSVVRGVGGLPTAFVATTGEGGSAIGILLEYDALPALGNAAVPSRRAVVRNGAGHACGHNLIGAANATAAIVAARVAREAGLPGRIVAYGTPAEEILVGKVVMLYEGAFVDADVLLTHHADYHNAAVTRPCQSIVHGEIAFCGRSAHTGVARGQNALDALELLVQTVERLRAHQFPDVSIEHAIRSPTFVMPSNTPEEIRAWFYVRHASYERADRVYGQLLELAQGAAATVGVCTRSAVISSCNGYLPNDVLARLLYEKLEQVGAPRWSKKDMRFMADLCEAFDPGSGLSLDREIVLLDEGIDAYGQDDGEVSWHVPLGRVNYACPQAIPLHSWAATAFFGTGAAWAGAAMCSQAIALAAVDLLRDAGLVGTAKDELRRRVPATPPRTAPGAWRELVADPARFWAGSWEMPT